MTSLGPLYFSCLTCDPVHNVPTEFLEVFVSECLTRFGLSREDESGKD